MSHPKCQRKPIRSTRKPPLGNSTTPAPKPPRDSFQVVVQCESEQEQEQLYDEFRSRNLTVRLLTM